MLRYTLVVEGPTLDDALSWLYVNVDTERLALAEHTPSAFLGHWIFKLEGSLDEYNRCAFEGSLNHEMNDLGSGLVWWNLRRFSEGKAA